MTNEFEIVEIRVEEGVDLGFGNQGILYFPMWCHMGNSFCRSMLCKGYLPMNTNFNANIGCVPKSVTCKVPKVLPNCFFIIEYPQYKLVGTSHPYVCHLLICPHGAQNQVCHSLVDSTPHYGGWWV